LVNDVLEQVAKKFKLGFCPYSARGFLKELGLFNIDTKYAYDLKLIYNDRYENQPVFMIKYRFI